MVDTTPTLLRRVAVIGTTGSGKTTLARRLAATLGVPHVELDALHWEPGWTSAGGEVLRERLAGALAHPSWVTDGNYTSMTGAMHWRAAHAVIWLDYPARVILPRLFRRTVSRIVSREQLWSDNRESFRTAFLSRESLFVWLLRTHWRHRREWTAMLARPEFAHLHVVRLRRPRETEQWLRGIGPQVRP